MDDLAKQLMREFSMLRADVRENAIMTEQLVDQNKAILEYVSEVPGMATRLEHVEQDVAELKSDMKVVKAAVTDLSNQVHDHERRITRLEAA